MSLDLKNYEIQKPLQLGNGTDEVVQDADIIRSFTYQGNSPAYWTLAQNKNIKILQKKTIPFDKTTCWFEAVHLRNFLQGYIRDFFATVSVM